MANIFSCLGLIRLRLRHRCWSRGIFWPLWSTIFIKNKSLAQQWPCIILAIIVLKHSLFKSLDFLITPLRWHASSSWCRGLFIVLDDCWGVKDLIDVCLIHHFPLVDIHSIPIFFLSVFIRIFFFVINAIYFVIFSNITFDQWIAKSLQSRWFHYGSFTHFCSGQMSQSNYVFDFSLPYKQLNYDLFKYNFLYIYS